MLGIFIVIVDEIKNRCMLTIEIPIKHVNIFAGMQDAGRES